MLSEQWGFRGANGKLELCDRKAEGHLKQSGQGFRMVTVGTKTKLENFSAAKDFFATTTERIDLNVYIVGAGA